MVKLFLVVCAFLFFFERISGQSYYFVNRYARKFDSSSSQSIQIPVDLSPYNGFTIEAWVYWKIINNDIPNANQTLLFYGTDNNYVWITPFDGVSGSNGNGFPSSVIGYDPIGGVKVNDQYEPLLTGFASVPSSQEDTTQYWSHIALSMNKDGTGSFYVDPEGASSGYPKSLTDIAFNFDTPNGILYFGDVPSSVKSELNTPPFDGWITEIRIWNTSRSLSDIQNLRRTSLSGEEEGLLHYYRLQEKSGTEIFDSAGTLDVTLSGNGPTAYGIPLSSSGFGDYVFPPIYDVKRISKGSRESISINGYGYSTFDPTPVTISKVPTSGELSLNGEIITSTSTTTGGQNLTTLFVPDRNTCGTTISYQLKSTKLTPDPNYSFVFPKISPEITGTKLLTTLSQSITFTGSFGLDGDFLPSEYIKLTLDGSIPPVNCTNPKVSGNTLTCTLGEGVGANRNLEINICGSKHSYPNAISYEPPTIDTTQGIDLNVLTIDGSNFGPSRIIGNNSDEIDGVFINGTACHSVKISQTNINCTYDFELGGSYPLEVIIGGQSVSTNISFVVCSKKCGGGAVCIAKDTCNCSAEYELPFCLSRVECTPTCKNGGVCVRSTGGGTACQCTNDAGTVDCSESNTALVIGVSVGVAAFIIIVIITIVAIILLKREKREGKNFVPLEKKDFSKIIYGDQLHQSPEKGSGNLKDLETLLIEDMEVTSVISNITQITEADKIAKALIIVYQDNDKVLQLLEKFISQEVETTESAGTLFRSNSMVSKMFKFYSRLIGLPYLYLTIGPEISKLIEEELGLEVDPEKMEEGKDLDEMRWSLMSQSQKILKQIMSSDDRCPGQFRQLFGHLKQVISKRFPENVNTTIGGFIFLRFFCPAISSPEAYGILDEPPSADSRRLLILITKVLQNLSNDVEFGSKEPYMTKMNDFIHSNRSKLVTFYDKITKPSPKDAPCVLPKNIKGVSLSVLSLHIRDNLSKITDPELKAKLQSIVE